MEIYKKAAGAAGLSRTEIREALLSSLEGRKLKKVLILPPDFTRYHSGAGFITNVYYHALREKGCQVDIMPALGTHVPITRGQAEKMFGDIPYEKFIPHNWRTDMIKLGEVPGD